MNEKSYGIEKAEKIRKKLEADVNARIKSARSADFETKPLWHDIIERANNFYWDSDTFNEQIEGKEFLFESLHNLCASITENLSKPHEIKSEIVLRMVFKEIFVFWFKNVEELRIFDKNVQLTDDVLDAYFFFTLVMFVTSTKKIDGMLLREFVYEYSHKNYHNKHGHGNYAIFKKRNKVNYEFLKNDECTFRKNRDRLLLSRKIQQKRPQRESMPKSSENEWALYFIVDGSLKGTVATEHFDDDLIETFKRMGNLYNEPLSNASSLSSEDEKGYYKKTDEYKKFLNRLKNIKYGKFLELSKKILEHIQKDERFYGINLYRFERMFRLHNITNTINLLLKSNDEKEKRDILLKDIYLNDIDFPSLYQTFSNLEDLDYVKHCADIFLIFKETIAISCCLILDALVEKKCLGDDWDSLFLDTINEMAKKIYYDPEDINYSIDDKSQECFENIRSLLVRYELNIPLFSDEKDSDL